MSSKFVNKIRLIYRQFLKRNYIRYDISSDSKTDILKLNFGTKWSQKDTNASLLVVRENAKLNVLDKFRIYSGAKIYVNKGAILSLGSGYINHNLNLSCFYQIEIGHNVAISENVSIRDSDNHTIIKDDIKSVPTQSIKIGDHVWIGMNVTILKGVVLGNNVVVAAGSVVNKSFPDNVLIGGVPARVIKHDITWK